MKKSKKRLIIEVAVLLLAIGILAPQFLTLLENMDTIKNISLTWSGLALAIFLFTIPLSAASYIFLSSKNLPFGWTLMVQLASGFTNRILPSGTGAIAINTLYLKKRKLSTEEAVATASINNLLGFLGFIIIMVLLRVYDYSYEIKFYERFNIWHYIVAIIIALGLVVFIIKKKNIKKKIAIFSNKIIISIKQILSRPISALMSLLANCGITLVHLACLLMCVLSAGYVIPIEFLAIVLLATIFSISVSPTPSGLGVSEAVMSSTLVLYGLPEVQALVVTLNYRLITYWIPILPGYLAYRMIRTRKII